MRRVLVVDDDVGEPQRTTGGAIPRLGGKITAVNPPSDLLLGPPFGLIAFQDRRRASAALTSSTMSGVPGKRGPQQHHPFEDRHRTVGRAARPGRQRVADGREIEVTLVVERRLGFRRQPGEVGRATKVVDMQERRRPPVSGDRLRQRAANRDLPLPSSPSTAITDRAPSAGTLAGPASGQAVWFANRGSRAGRGRRRRARRR